MDELPSTTFLFIRHAQQARGEGGRYHRDSLLTDLGRRQASTLAPLLAPISPTARYTSPFRRAFDTAMLACVGSHITPVVDARLAEFEIADAGQGMRPDLLVWRPEHRGTEGGETLLQFFLRVAAFCEEAARRHMGAKVAVVARSGSIDAAVRWALASPLSSRGRTS